MDTDEKRQKAILRTRWRTPAGVYLAPLKLLGRRSYDLDAASEYADDITVPAKRRLTREDDALVQPWFSSDELVGGDLDARPLVFLNPPFGPVAGGIAAWAETALSWSAQGAVVAFYGPVYGDRWADRLEATALTTIRVGGGRVKHPAPPGLTASSPLQHAHRIWMLGSADLAGRWPYPPRIVWDWRKQVFVGPHLGSGR